MQTKIKIRKTYPAQFPALMSKTILDRCKEYMSLNHGTLTNEQFCAFVSVENVKTQLMLSEKNEKRIEALRQDCLNFFNFFSGFYIYEDDIKRTIRYIGKYFGCEPLILKLGREASIHSASLVFPFEEGAYLNKTQIRRQKSLIDYLLNTEANCHVTFRVYNDIDGVAIESHLLNRSLNDEEVQNDHAKWLRDCIIKCAVKPTISIVGYKAHIAYNNKIR